MTNVVVVAHLLDRSRRIKANPNERGTLSRGQVAEIGLLLNRPDWLAESGFTLAEAIARLTHAELDDVVAVSRLLDSPVTI